MIDYVRYDPSRHKDLPLLFIGIGSEHDGTIPMEIRPVTDPVEREFAAQVWWHYWVAIEVPDEVADDAPPLG
jgi:hypothetical protein